MFEALPTRLVEQMKRISYFFLYPKSQVSFSALLVGRVKVGENVFIGNRSLIKDSILNDRIYINHRCKISNSTLAENIRVDSDVYLDNSSIGANSIIESGSQLIRSLAEHTNYMYAQSCAVNCKIGAYSYLGSKCVINDTILGRFCSVGPELMCGLGEHPTRFASTSPIFYSTLKQCVVSFANKNHFDEIKPIQIGNDVWIGSRVFIRNGVMIGSGAIIGAGSVIVNDIPDYAIVGGVPGKIIRFRYPPDVISQLLQIAWWNWSQEKLRKAQALFVQEDINLFLDWVFNHIED